MHIGLLKDVAGRDFHFEANLCQQVGFFLFRAITAQVAHPVKLGDLLICCQVRHIGAGFCCRGIEEANDIEVVKGKTLCLRAALG